MKNCSLILDGPRIEPGLNIKLDTSLDNDLPDLSSGDLNTSFRSSSPELGVCYHTRLLSYENYETCFQCGVYVPKNGVKSYKSQQMNYQAFFSPKTIFKSMTRRSFQFKQVLNPEYAQMRHTYVEWIIELAENFKISCNSIHLATLLLDLIMFQDTSLTSKLQLYAPVCLLVAAKTIELDERIPYIPKLKRFANTTYTIEDYRRAELKVLDLVDWNPQLSSSLEITEFLLCQGVLFSTDEVEEDYYTPEKSTKLSPEVLKEKVHYDNLSYKNYERKDSMIPKYMEKDYSPSAKENNENSYSDLSTNGTLTDNLGTPYTNGSTRPYYFEDELSPKHMIPTFLKQHSTPANIEHRSFASRPKMPLKKKVKEILAHLETSYVKLSTLLLKDVEFIEWEPRVISAATITFLRCVNRVSPIWNSELEKITNLKFSQLSSCFELIYKKQSMTFNRFTPKLQEVLYTPKNTKDLKSDLKLVKAHTITGEKTSYPQPKFESASKLHLLSDGYTCRSSIPISNLVGHIDHKPFERKPIFNYQSKTNVPAAVTANVSSSYTFLRDDLKQLRTSYGDVGVSAELQRNQAKNPIFSSSSYQSTRYDPNQDYFGSYSGCTTTRASTSNVSATAGSYLPAATQYGLATDSYLKPDPVPCKNPSASLLSNKISPTFENLPYQSKLGFFKK